MPKLFVVTDETDTASLATAILGVRIGAARREAAIAAQRLANAGIDLDRLRPGQILTVPDGPDLADRTGDAVAVPLDDLVDRGAAALGLVPEETDRAEAARRAEAEAMRAVLGTREVARISANNPQLKQNVASVARDLEIQDAESEQERRALADAIGVWTEQLKAIRGLADR
jgi:hypothetical protein